MILHLISFSFTNENLCEWNNNAFCNLYLGYDQTEKRKHDIQRILYNLITRKFGTNGYQTSMTLSCIEDCPEGRVAFFTSYIDSSTNMKHYPNTAKITFCPSSFNSSSFSTTVPPFHDTVLQKDIFTSLGGVILHEMTHAFADTTDGENLNGEGTSVYGQHGVLTTENVFRHNIADAWRYYGDSILTRMILDKIIYPPETAEDALKLVRAGLNHFEYDQMCNSDFCKQAHITRGKDMIRVLKLSDNFRKI